MMVQSQLRADQLAAAVTELMMDGFVAQQMKDELSKWHYPTAADQIIKSLLKEPDATTRPQPHPAALRFRPG
jgi:UDP-N-acetylglucosamine:LPS N-acetylglucosamine transferase